MNSKKISSPCIGICKLENEICIGCSRTKEHIINWKKYSEEERKNIMKTLQEENSYCNYYEVPTNEDDNNV